MTGDEVLGPLPLEGVVPFGPPPETITVEQLAELVAGLGFAEGVVRLTTEVQLTPTEVRLWHVDPTTPQRLIGWRIRVAR